MALTVQQVLDAARDRHPAFSRPQTPDATALRLLDALQRELLAHAAFRNPDALAVRLSVPLPLADFAAGVALPAGARVTALLATGPTPTSCTRSVPLLDPSLGRTTLLLGGYVEAGRLYLTSDEEMWKWAAPAALVVCYVPAAAPLQTLQTALVLPDDALEALTAQLAARMALRGGDGASAVAFAQAGALAERTWLDSLGARRVGQVFQVTEG